MMYKEGALHLRGISQDGTFSDYSSLDFEYDNVRNGVFFNDNASEQSDYLENEASTNESRDGSNKKSNLRLEWNSTLEYLLSCFSFVSGLTTVVQFPLLASKHGGGAYVLAYLLLMMVCGVPLTYLNVAIGQFTGKASVRTWQIIPLFKGLGFGKLILAVLMLLYNCTYASWSLYYLCLSASSYLPWDLAIEKENSTIEDLQTDDTSSMSAYRALIQPVPKPPWLSHSTNSIYANNTHLLYYLPTANYFFKNILDIGPSIGIPGRIQPHLILCLLLICSVLFLTLFRGPRITGRVVYVTSVIPGVIIISLLVQCCYLDGAKAGIQFYLTPHWNKFTDIQLWCDAGRQVFMSLGLGSGVLLSLSSMTGFHSRCYRNSILICIGNVFMSSLSGFLSFAIFGVISKQLAVPIGSLLSHDFESTFIIFPYVITLMKYSSVWSALYFFLLIIAALNSGIFLLVTIIKCFSELRIRQTSPLPQSSSFHLPPTLSSSRRFMFMTFMCCMLLLLPGLLLFSQAGLYFSVILSVFTNKWSALIMGFLECMILMYAYSAKTFVKNIGDMLGEQASNLGWRITWKFVTPFSITVLLILTCVSVGDNPLKLGAYDFPLLSKTVGWLLSSLSVWPIIAAGVIGILKERGELEKRIRKLLQVWSGWHPRVHVNSHISSEIPDYIACSPESHAAMDRRKTLTVTTGLLSNLFTLTSVADAYVPELYEQSVVVQKWAEHPADLANLIAHETEADGIDDSSDDDEDEENSERGKWAGRLEFILSCQGFLIGLGNIWRFPFLVYRNGGGAFFIPYLIMLLFCGMPLVYMELAFGQYASLGPITIWKCVPLFKGLGFAMVILSAMVCVYYNMVVAWAMHYLFSSMSANLPWESCHNSWNTKWCSATKYAYQSNGSSATNGSLFMNSDISHDESSMEKTNPLADIQVNNVRHNSPGEEYFYLSFLNVTGGIENLDEVRWQLALCLLLVWVIIFVCLVKGIKSSGKVMYLIVIFPYISLLVLLVRAMLMDGCLAGIKYYITPNWESLKSPRVWRDAAAQVFFSLSTCWGGLITLSSYNKFHNNVYRDAILVCLGDTLMSVLSGFAIFAMIGVLSEELKTTVDHVIKSDMGLAFIVYPEAISLLPVSPLWSTVFFLMLTFMGLSTQATSVETVITALIDENREFLKKRRMLMLVVLCCFLYLLGLPLTAKGGIYWLHWLDHYINGWTTLVVGLCTCLVLSWIYGVNKFCANVGQMIGHSPSLWWKIMWSAVTPVIIIFILGFSIVAYEPLEFHNKRFPVWTEVLGFIVSFLPLAPIPGWMIYKLVTTEGTLKERLTFNCQPCDDWGPALERFWTMEFMTTVQMLMQPLHDLSIGAADSIASIKKQKPLNPLHLKHRPSESSLLPLTIANSPISKKYHENMRCRAIMNHAYSNPQCNSSNASTEKLASQLLSSCTQGEYIIVPRRKGPIQTHDVSTQTPKYKEKVKSKISNQSIYDSPAILEVTDLSINPANSQLNDQPDGHLNDQPETTQEDDS